MREAIRVDKVYLWHRRSTFSGTWTASKADRVSASPKAFGAVQHGLSGVARAERQS